ncbi:MAG: ShlB/FhaC/HecB family hemolysin secretion/activation protein [Candidatus Omnitrophota bacterium]
MLRKIFLWITTGVVLGIYSSPLVLAADETTQAAARETVSPAETFARERERAKPSLGEKPEIISEEEKEELAAEDKGPFFTLKKIAFEGNTVFPEKEFEKYAAGFLNRKTSFLELKKLAKQVTNHYRLNGYITSRAYLPPQTIAEDTVTIRVMEGWIDRIWAEGNKFFGSHLYTRAVRIPKDKPFQYQDLENSLYFFNQRPDRIARAYLIAGEKPGTSDIILKAEETFPLHLSYEFNNRGTRLTHRARQLAHLDHNNLLGQGDILNASYAFAEQDAFHGGSWNYTLPMDETRTRLHFDGSVVESSLVKHIKPFEVEGESLTMAPGLTQSFVQTPAFTFDGYLGFEFKDSKTLVDDLKTSFDRLRILRMGPRFTWQDPRGRTFLNGDFHWGIPDFLGSDSEVDENASRPNAGGEFLYYTANLARLQRLPWASFLLLRAGTQLTNDNLPSPEQFRVGGAYTVRGYPESDSVGDTGYNFSAELNIPSFFFPKTWEVPFQKRKWTDTVRWVGFVDGGAAYFRERAFEGEVKNRFLLGTGFGVRVDMGKTFSLQLDLGWPLGDKSTDEDQWQTHLALRAGF